jgi:hypothetical protein
MVFAAMNIKRYAINLPLGYTMSMGKGTGTSKCREAVSLAGAAALSSQTDQPSVGTENQILDRSTVEQAIKEYLERFGEPIPRDKVLDWVWGAKFRWKASQQTGQRQIESALDSLLASGHLLQRSATVECPRCSDYLARGYQFTKPENVYAGCDNIDCRRGYMEALVVGTPQQFAKTA